MNEQPDITGKYRHYKGGEYEVIGVGKHTETEEKLVIYRAVDPPHQIWTRPYNMFFELVEIEGKTIPRFERIY